jgi:hypothetical protein
MDRGRSASSSVASSVSAPPSSRGERSLSQQSDVPLIVGSGRPGAWGDGGGRGTVHTGFTSSSDGGSSTSRSPSSTAFPHGAAGAYRNHTTVVGPSQAAAAAVVHTGFTTSEDSGSATSRSRASSPSLSRPSSSAQLFSGAAQAQQRLRSAQLVHEQNLAPPAASPFMKDESASHPPPHPVSAWEQSVGFRFASAATAARPLAQPAKADTTPRRKVSPVAPLGTHSFQERANQQKAVGSSPARHELRGAHIRDAPMTVNSDANQLPLLWESALPPSTLIDLRMRLDILSNAKLAVREEELIKELQRTQQELTRRGMPLSLPPPVLAPATSQLAIPLNSASSIAPVAARPSSEPLADDDEFHGNVQRDVGWSEDDAALDYHQTRDMMTTPRNRSAGNGGRGGGGGQRRAQADTPASPTASRLRQYAHNLLDITQKHHTGNPRYRSSVSANDLSPLLKSPPSRAHQPQHGSATSSQHAPHHHQYQGYVESHQNSRPVYDEHSRREREPRALSHRHAALYDNERRGYDALGGSSALEEYERDSQPRRQQPRPQQEHFQQQHKQRRDTTTGPQPQRVEYTDPMLAFQRDDDRSLGHSNADGGGGVWNELAMLRRIRTG